MNFKAKPSSVSFVNRIFLNRGYEREKRFRAAVTTGVLTDATKTALPKSRRLAEVRVATPNFYMPCFRKPPKAVRIGTVS